MLSICTTIKNRSRVKTDNGIQFLFPTCIESLAKSLTLTDDVELIVSDWESSDWPIREWIEDKLPHIPIHIINIKAEGFSAGKGRNIAASQSTGNNLFFMDADMIVNKAVIQEGIKQTEAGNVYYPTVKYEIENSGKLIIHEGGGNVFITKETFYKAGKWPEYWSHGFEDTDFAQQVKQVANVVTNEDIYIFHQWHPQTALFKTKHASKDVEKTKELENRRRHYLEQRKKEEEDIAKAIDIILKQNPNTTHSNLNKPVKADNRRLRL